MPFAILCTFRPGALAEAKQRRLEHYEFLARVKETIREGGPLLGSDGVPTGMLIIVDRPTAGDAEQFIREEPYTKAGLFAEVVVRRWSHVIPEPEPGFVNAELEKERVVRA